MPTKDAFNPDHPLPLVLADEPEQHGNVKTWDRAVIWSRVFKASILVATATAVGIAILWVGNPVTLFAEVTASVVDKSALQPSTDRSTPTIQSTADAEALPPTGRDAPAHVLSVEDPMSASAEVTASVVDKSALQPGTDQSAPIQSSADAQALPPTAKDAPSRDEIGAASEPAGQKQTENSEPSSEALFRQFQAWAAEKECAGTGRASTGSSRCPNTGCGKCPSISPAHAKAPTRPARP